MSTRSRPPTGEAKAGIFDPKPVRAKKSTEHGVPSGRHDELEVATPTEVSASLEDTALRVISMKTPADPDTDRKRALEVKQHIVKLRPISDITPVKPIAMGYLAPPRDPKEVRARRVRDYVIWGSCVVIVGCAVMIAIWLLARR
jgi:hypothetical protein